jgi:hypothetical protein
MIANARLLLMIRFIEIPPSDPGRKGQISWPLIYSHGRRLSIIFSEPSADRQNIPY